MNTYCIVIPAYNCGALIEPVLEALIYCEYPVVVVNDASNEETSTLLATIAEKQGFVTLVQRSENGGKGAAVRDGLFWAKENGFTHAIQIDADGQHDIADLPKFVAAAENTPTSLILGAPIFSEEAPLGRRIGRQISIFWVMLETLSRAIEDPLFGYRVYPVDATVSLLHKSSFGLRMDFDPEIAVRLYWAGLDVVTVRSAVVYHEEGVSHFDMWRDNVRISKMHTRLFLGMIPRVFTLLKRHFS